VLDDGLRNVTTAPAAAIDSKLERLTRRATPVRKKLADLDAQAAPLRKKLNDLDTQIAVLRAVRDNRDPGAAGADSNPPGRTSDSSLNGHHRGIPETSAARGNAASRSDASNAAPRPSRAIVLEAPSDPTGRKQLLLDRFGREPLGFEFSIGDALQVVREYEPTVKRRAVEMMLKRMATENDLLIKVAVGRYRLAPQAFGELSHALGEVPASHPGA
jgi:hypothetical protein